MGKRRTAGYPIQKINNLCDTLLRSLENPKNAPCYRHALPCAGYPCREACLRLSSVGPTWMAGTSPDHVPQSRWTRAGFVESGESGPVGRLPRRTSLHRRGNGTDNERNGKDPCGFSGPPQGIDSRPTAVSGIGSPSALICSCSSAIARRQRLATPALRAKGAIHVPHLPVSRANCG